jgi:hypothetical protein
MKRAREDCDGEEHPAKVRRLANTDQLSKLSDELLVRILSFVPVTSLLVCQRYVSFLAEGSNARILTLQGYRRSCVILR